MDNTSDSIEESGQAPPPAQAVLPRATTSKKGALGCDSECEAPLGAGYFGSIENEDVAERWSRTSPPKFNSGEGILSSTKMPENESDTSALIPETPRGVRVVYGSCTIKGCTHPNEDRLAFATLNCWPQPGEAQKHPSVAMIGGAHTAGDTASGDCWTVDNNEADGNELQQRRAYCWICCDGHDGPQAAEHFIEHFPSIFQRLLLSTDAKLSAPQTEQKISSTLVLAHVEEDRLLRSAFDDTRFNPGCVGHPNFSRMRCTSGTCVTTVFMLDSQVWFANLGDCTAWLLRHQADGIRSRSTDAGLQTDNVLFSKVTTDHRASEASEKKRIAQLHGRIICGRVGGLLEPSRTIGDFDVKDTQPANVVTCVPDVRFFNATGPSLIFMGTDGIWDKIKEHDIVNLLQKHKMWKAVLSWLRVTEPITKHVAANICPEPSILSAISDLIVRKARQKGSEDDASCTTILLLPTTDD